MYESGNLLLHAAQPSSSSKFTPQTCSWSLRSRPSSWGRRVRPGPGAAASGVQRRGAPGRPRELRDREEAEERRAGTVNRERGPLDSDWASSTSRGAGSGDDCSSLALLSPQPQLQPKTKTLPTCQQRRSSLGRAARASEQRGEGERRSARRRRRGTTPPPLPGAAGDGRPERSRTAAAAAARAGSRVPGRQAHREQERQGSA